MKGQKPARMNRRTNTAVDFVHRLVAPSHVNAGITFKRRSSWFKVLDVFTAVPTTWVTSSFSTARGNATIARTDTFYQHGLGII